MARRYEFRPAKAAQRKMVVDACRRLTAIAPVEDFQYVGFGGLEFIDFIEFHRGLGVSTMTSIERDTNIQHRLKFNAPYKSIKILMGEARDRLPDVDWSRLSITWLDYTDVLTGNILRDVDYVIRECQAGSIVLVTVNGASTSVPLKERLPGLKKHLGDLVSDNLVDGAMNGWGAAREQRRILQERANSVARAAHSGQFRQLFNFEYADDAKMLTWGGIVCSPSLDRTIDGCRFEDLHFIRTSGTPFEVSVPVLTEREMNHLENELVGSGSPLPQLRGVTPKEVRDFAEVYRWRVGPQ